jgi:hypothetical protein
LEVPIAKDDVFKFVPTATQVVSTGHAIASRLVPFGIDVVTDQSVKSFVLIVVAPPPPFSPAATHVVEAEQEMAVNRVTAASG